MNETKIETDVRNFLSIEKVEEFICFNVDVLEEELLMTRENEEDTYLVFNKSNVDDIFELINKNTLECAYYINDYEIEVILNNNKKINLEIIG